MIADLLGVPDEDREEFVKNMHRNVGGGIGSTDAKALAHSPLEFLYATFARLHRRSAQCAARRCADRHGGGDVPGRLHPRPDGRGQGRRQRLLGGQETTVRLLGSALRIIGERPDIQQRLRDDRSLIPNFIEEVLRFESPVKGDFRLSRVDSEIGGVHVPAARP